MTAKIIYKTVVDDSFPINTLLLISTEVVIVVYE